MNYNLSTNTVAELQNEEARFRAEIDLLTDWMKDNTGEEVHEEFAQKHGERTGLRAELHNLVLVINNAKIVEGYGK